MTTVSKFLGPLNRRLNQSLRMAKKFKEAKKLMDKFKITKNFGF